MSYTEMTEMATIACISSSCQSNQSNQKIDEKEGEKKSVNTFVSSSEIFGLEILGHVMYECVLSYVNGGKKRSETKNWRIPSCPGAMSLGSRFLALRMPIVTVENRLHVSPARLRGERGGERESDRECVWVCVCVRVCVWAREREGGGDRTREIESQRGRTIMCVCVRERESKRERERERKSEREGK